MDYLSAEVRDLSRDVLVGTTVELANVRGEGDAWGYNLGFQFKRECFSLAAGYRSDLSPEVSGTVESQSRPMSAAKTRTVAVVVGTSRNIVNASARPE